ncbi:U3 small nucleolar ribonucleoprotein protein MPP10 [Cryptotermes secundus]|uniref:U3 small nucleolar ribonucleoprotein protein MPP10 n=1 Tax=Cryptotermes secundus TaxID=105785 RepID=UPI000CD7BACA|nr:U3 small nucleolar ribonucleoprotein protein MPP10 [Cryptotermes secundus]
MKDRAWDDVEKKVKPVETPNEYKKKLVLDHENSKLSPAWIYEQPAPEVKIVSNIPAISLEEVAPVATSDAALLVPEEMQGRLKGDLIGKAERTSSDKKRERQHKVRQRARAVEQLRPGLGNKYSKARALRDLEKVTENSNITQVAQKTHAKAMRSSSAFFSRLQDEVRSHIKMKTAGSSQSQQKDVRSAMRTKL